MKIVSYGLKRAYHDGLCELQIKLTSIQLRVCIAEATTFGITTGVIVT
tara:strand:- start:529 stop:672 length:144 start_codon:yes stop_codon:yes gene_type:complete